MTKKLPFQISLEDLLEALEHSTESPSLDELISYTDDVPFFLSKFKIEAGEYFVRSSLLYKLYCIYSPSPVERKTFTKRAANFVPFNDPYFKLNISPIKLTKILNPPTNHNKLSSVSIKKHYETFLEVAKITKGSRFIEGFLLYEIYRYYCIDAKIMKRLKYEHFISISDLYFESKRIGESKGKWFKLDPEILDILGEEQILKVRERRKMSEKHKLIRKPKEKK